MAKGHLTLRATLKGEDDLTKPWDKALRKAERRAGRSLSRIEKAALRTKRAFTRVGVGFNRGVGALGQVAKRGVSTLGTLTKVAGGVAGTAALAVDQFGKFELQVARLGNLLPDNVDAVAEYERELRKLSIATGTDAIETAGAAYMAFSGGVETSKKGLRAFLPVALKAAKAGFTEPAVAVDALTSVLNTYKDSALTAAAVSDKLFVTEALGKTDFGQIASNIGNVAAFAKEMGLSFDEILAPTAALTKTGLTTSAAFTQLESLLGGLTAPTGAAAKALKKLKIPFGPDAIRDAGGVVGILERLKEVVDAKGQGVIQKIFGRKEAQKAAFALAGGGLADVKKTMKALDKASGTTEAKFANLEKRTGFKIQQMKTGFKLLVTELGGGIAEGLGLDQLANIPGGVESAGKKMRSGAKNFAEGFLQALIPGKQLADIDWNSVARDAGAGFGKFANALASIASGLSKFVKHMGEAISAVGSFLDAALKLDTVVNPADEAQAKTGAAATFAEDDTSFMQRGIGRLFGTASSKGTKQGELAAKIARGDLQLRQEMVDPATLMAEIAKREKNRGWIEAPKAKRGAAKMSKTLGNAGEPAQVGGVVKVEIGVKAEGATTSTKVESSSKNPRVPIKADVGKRKAASE